MNQVPNGIGRRSFLAVAAAAAAIGPGCARADPPPGMTTRPGLGTVAASKNILFGACSRGLLPEDGPPRIEHDASFSALFKHECRMLTTDFEVKMPNIRPRPDTWNFKPADLLMDYATANNMAFRGHCLLWSSVLPKWFASEVDASNAESFIIDHIHKVAGRYAGRVISWDVANEAITDGDEAADDGLRKGPLLSLMGPRYLDIAFKATHEADPKALLCLNQDAVEYDVDSQDYRREKTLGQLRRLLDAKVPIHALGIQSHLEPGWLKFTPEVLNQFLDDVAALGLKIFITELDVVDRRLPADIPARDQAAAEAMREYLAVVLPHPAVAMVNTWGLSDRYNWIEDSGMRRKDGRRSRAQLFDDDLAPKPVHQVLLDGLNAAPARGSPLALLP
ncbi:endo-1,4-beta-xylanase [Dongia sedimenti]|uniref:Beta-xylanase n=1 Tax=Dongia sedimenti TaxID=3064282 RepID=A0ABU0YU65_9PROT|nr:endo-1,4-beta-xylanase [Rhodospirillaceae bacterium R-7]